MICYSTISRSIQLAACAATLCLTVLLTPALAQDQDDTSRRFWPPNFRPPGERPVAASMPRRYKRATPELPKENLPSAALRNTVIGVTIWRLRPANETDETRILVKKRGKSLTPERIEAGEKLSVGQELRLGIEVPRTGYLYVVDREQYADGSFSDPILIFPDNPLSREHRIAAGRVVEIPREPDQPFEVKSLREGGQSPQVAEVLTMIVSSTPLKGLPKRAANDPFLRLPVAMVEKWEKEWGAQFERLELEGGAGAVYTVAEKAAGANSTKRLTQGDPLPQTIFRIAVKPGKPLMVRLPLMIGN